MGRLTSLSLCADLAFSLAKQGMNGEPVDNLLLNDAVLALEAATATEHAVGDAALEAMRATPQGAKAHAVGVATDRVDHRVGHDELDVPEAAFRGVGQAILNTDLTDGTVDGGDMDIYSLGVNWWEQLC